MTVLFVQHLITRRIIDPVAYFFQPLNLTVYWSTVLIVFGIIMGAVAAERYGVLLYQKSGFSLPFEWQGDDVWSALFWGLSWGVVGARAEVVLFPPPSLTQIGIFSARDFFQNPYLLINLSAGGLGISGGLVFGLIGLFLFCLRKKLPFLFWLDTAVFGMALGQSIGRWADFLNQDFYGKQTGLPWAITIDPIARLPEVADFGMFHPAFLYESIWLLLLFLGLLYLMKKRPSQFKQGQLSAIYLFVYGIGRLWIAPIRLNLPSFSIFSIQVPVIIIFSALMLVLSIFIWRFSDKG